jgi:site-specific recombinase XerD
MNLKSKSTLEKIAVYLNFKNYSGNSIKIYLHYCGLFLSSFDKDVYHISQSEAINWLLKYNYRSTSQQNQIISSVKFIYKFIVRCELSKFTIERPRKEKHLPRVIEKQHILNSIDKIENLKHKSIISLAFSVGLRVSEVVNLKIKDIDSDRMIININQAKGRKDRIVPLTLTVLTLLRKYYKEYKPKEYLFNGQFSNKYSSTSCNEIVKKYLGKSYHFHLLRHSCFTNLTESGVDIRIIQKLAGHSSCKTTEIYTHVSNNILHKLPLAI